MRHHTLGSKFADRTLFLNLGLCLASALLSLRFALGYRAVPAAALLEPSMIFALAAAAAAFATHQRVRQRLSITAAPLPLFALANLLAGNQRTWVVILLVLSTVAWLAVFALRRRDIYDQDADRIDIRLR